MNKIKARKNPVNLVNPVQLTPHVQAVLGKKIAAGCMRMLIQTIVDEFNTYFDQDPNHDTILWFDPHREWEGLLPYLKPRLPLLVFAGSQLHLREALRR